MVSNFRALHSCSSHYPSTAASTIYNITINSALSISYTLVSFTIVYQHNAEREEAREGVRYNRTFRGLCSGSFINGNRFMNIFLWFFNLCDRFNKKTYYFNKLVVIILQFITTPSFFSLDRFALAIPYFFLFDL